MPRTSTIILINLLLSMLVHCTFAHMCFGYHSSDAVVCNSRKGQCVAKNTCQCPDGFTGRQCLFQSNDAFVERVVEGFSGVLAVTALGELYLSDQLHQGRAILNASISSNLYHPQIRFGSKNDTTTSYNDPYNLGTIDNVFTNILALAAPKGRYLSDYLFVLDENSFRMLQLSTLQITNLEAIYTPELVRIAVGYDYRLYLLEGEDPSAVQVRAVPFVEQENGVHVDVSLQETYSANCIGVLPTSFLLDMDSTIYISTANQIFRIPTWNHAHCELYAGVATPGYFDTTNPLQAQFSGISDIIYHPHDNSLYIAEAESLSIRKIASNGKVSTLFRKPAFGVPPAADSLLADFTLRVMGAFTMHPQQSHLYIADTTDNAVYRITDGSHTLVNLPHPGSDPGMCFGYGTVKDSIHFRDDFEGTYDRTIWESLNARLEYNSKCTSFSGNAMTVNSMNWRDDRVLRTRIFDVNDPLDVDIAFYIYLGTQSDSKSDCPTVCLICQVYLSITEYPKNGGSRITRALKRFDRQYFRRPDYWNTGSDGRFHVSVRVSHPFSIKLEQNWYSHKGDMWAIDAFSIDSVDVIDSEDEFACGGHGSCMGTDRCVCVEGVTGEQCTLSALCDASRVYSAVDSLSGAPTRITHDDNGILYTVDPVSSTINVYNPVSHFGSSRRTNLTGVSHVTFGDGQLWLGSRHSTSLFTAPVKHATHIIPTEYLADVRFVSVDLAESGDFFCGVTQESGMACYDRTTGLVLEHTQSNHSHVGHKDGRCADAIFYSPTAIVYSTNDTFYISDTKNHVIRSVWVTVSPPSCEVRTVAGVLAQDTASYVGHRDGLASQAQFSNILGMAFLRSTLFPLGALFIADGKFLRRFSVHNALVTTEAGFDHSLAFSSLKNYPSTGLPLLQTPFLMLTDVTIVGNSIFVLDSLASRIYEIRYEMSPECGCAEWLIGSVECKCDMGLKKGSRCDETRYSCFGFDSENSQTCSGNGKCALPDVCQCQEGFYGEMCEINECDENVASEFVTTAESPTALQRGVGIDGAETIRVAYGDKLDTVHRATAATITSESLQVSAARRVEYFYQYTDNHNFYHSDGASIYANNVRLTHPPAELVLTLNATFAYLPSDDTLLFISSNGILSSFHYSADNATLSRQVILSDSGYAGCVAVHNNVLYWIERKAIYRYTSSQGARLFAGHEYIARATNGALLTARFVNPTLLTVDQSTGDLFVLDAQSTGEDGNVVRHVGTSTYQRVISFGILPEDFNAGSIYFSHQDRILYYTVNSGVNQYLYNMSTLCHCSEWTPFGACTPCEYGWRGSSCDQEILRCYGAFESDPEVCNSHGSCDAPNTCTCLHGWDTLKNCSMPTCFEVAAWDSLVCSQHGKCVDPNVCDCQLGYQFENCLGCGPGRYQTLVEDTLTCIACPAGTYQAVDGAWNTSYCIPCPPHHYADSPGLSECIPCREGEQFSTLVYGASDPSLCVKCGPGYISRTGEQCDQCPPGTWSSEWGSASCTPCPAGYWSDASAAISNVTCKPCPRGTWSDTLGGTLRSCVKCPAGYWSETDAATSPSTCIACLPGTANGIAGANTSLACVPCARGSHASGSAATSCQSCPVATFADDVGMQNCTSCPPGTTTTTLGADSQNECGLCGTPGLWANGAQGCVPCARGTASSNLAQSAPCPECDNRRGFYADTMGMAQCLRCAPGRETLTKDACTPCEAGTYSLQGIRCERAPPGTYTNREFAAESVALCPEGTWNPEYGATNSSFCRLCAPGYVSSPGAPDCTLCAPGHYSNAQRTVCTPCPSGTFTDAEVNPSIKSCRLCSAGTYNPHRNATSCIPCDPPEACPLSGSSVQIPLVSSELSAKREALLTSQHLVINPTLGGEDLTLASLISKYTALSFFLLCCGAVLACALGCALCINGRGNMFSVIRKLDIFFTMTHRVEYGHSVIKRKTFCGGCLTVVSMTAICILFLVSLSDLLFDNIMIAESFTTPQSSIFENSGRFAASVFFIGEYSACSTFEVKYTGFSPEDDETPVLTGCARENTFNGSLLVDSCHCRFHCENCHLDGVAQSISINAPGVVTNVIAYHFSVPYFIKNTAYELNGTLVAQEEHVFYGEKTTELFVQLFNTLFYSYPGGHLFAPVVNMFPFLAPGERKPLVGLQSQLQSISLGDFSSAEALTVDGSGVSVRFSLSLSNFIFLLQEELRQTTLNFIAQVSSLTALVLTIAAAIMGRWEDITKCFTKRQQIQPGSNEFASLTSRWPPAGGEGEEMDPSEEKPRPVKDGPPRNTAMFMPFILPKLPRIRSNSKLLNEESLKVRVHTVNGVDDLQSVSSGSTTGGRSTPVVPIFGENRVSSDDESM